MRRHIPCPTTPEPPRIGDGIESPAWKAAQWVDGFVDIRGAGHGTPDLPTRFKWMWDETHLYLAAEMGSDGLVAAQTAHDSDVFEDDCFELFLDPDSDGHNYLEWEVNPLGTTLDLCMDKPYLFGGRRDDSWEVGGLGLHVQTCGQPNDAQNRATGWSFEAAFPWAALGRRPKPGDTWLCNLMRVAWPLVDIEGRLVKDPAGTARYWVAGPTGLIDIHRPHAWPVIGFVESPSDPIPEWPGSGPVGRLAEQAGLGARSRSDGPGFSAPLECDGWRLDPDGRFFLSA